jgi:polyhydroxyalkanoate synthesis regulator phasin
MNMKAVFVIVITLVGMLAFMGGRMVVSPKLETAQDIVVQLEKDKKTLEDQLENMKDGLMTDAEKRRIERERKELASLRGEVSQLRKQVAELETAQKTAAKAPGKAEPAEEEDTFTPADYYAASVNVEVEPGMTLVTGGWQTSQGRRTYVFLTPKKGDSPDGSSYVQISTRVANIADADLGLFQLQGMKASGNETENAGGFGEDDIKALYENLQQNPNATIMSSPSLVTASGREGVVQTIYAHQVDGELERRQLEIGVLPVVNDEGIIELNLAATINEAPTAAAAGGAVVAPAQ